ncbi:uncharacterized protein [Porites lutea]|uniref:uncharacterized protein n=1 Tax=Porites lutea TaxID=51062 RepID=UPI003CC5F3E4
MTTLNEISGVIASPFYPRRGYLDNQSCSWEIRARKGKRIVFTIEDMDFNWWCSGRWSCLCDSLEIQGGSISGYDGPKWRLCATLSTANATYDWFKQRIKVLFFSNGSIQWGRGFKISYTQVNFSVSGCSNYTTLNDSNRAMTHNRSISYLCDANLNGWYRFNGEAGTQMADSCVNMYHCGTESPGWLNGTHPDLADGAVKRQVCFSSFDNCCHHSNEITVQHCGGFYVYKLEGQSHCNLRYCGNGSPYAQECYNYKVLNETSRSKIYNESYHQCDHTLSTDWYRFSGAAGNQMAESCIDMYRCGTRYPGWLNGSLPTVNEGAVQRRVCFRYFSDCCSFSTYIRVRNCGGFYVYQLKPLTYCYLRYCGNGYVSSTPTKPELPHTTTTKVTPARAPSTTDPEITPTQLPETTTTKITPATRTQSTTDPKITPTRALYSELENRSIVVIDIEKEIIGRRGSIRQKC